MLHSIMKSPSFSVTRACKTSVGEVPMPTVSSSYLCTLVHGVSEGMLTPATPIMPSTAHYTLLQVSNSQSTHRQITNFRGYNNDIISRGGIVRLTRVLLQGERNFQKHYLHEAFVASKRLKESRDNYTYPGQLRAACPGETQYGPLSPLRFIPSPHQRSCWPVLVPKRLMSFKRFILPTTVVPMEYDLTITPNMEQFTFDGSVVVKLAVATDLKELPSVTFNAAEIELVNGAVSVTTKDDDGFKFLHLNDLSKSKKEGGIVEVDETDDRISLYFENPISLDTLLTPSRFIYLKLNYKGIINDKMHGFYRSSYTVKGEPAFMGTTQFEAADARRAFPCWDEPALKATFTLTLVVPNIGYQVLANTQETHRSSPFKCPSSGEEKISVTFATTPIMSTYLLAWTFGHFECIEQKIPKTHSLSADSKYSSSGETLIRIFTPEGKVQDGQFALEVASRTLPLYEKFFGSNYILDKCDLIAIPDFACGAMENWGLITYRETALLINEKSSSLSRRWVALVVAHELAHQWFGNLVTMEWWKELWLNESFATWVEYWCIDQLFPKWDIFTQFVDHETSSAFCLDALDSSHPVEVDVCYAREIDGIFDAISYSKGGSVLRMVVEYIGLEAFSAGLKKYLKHFEFRNATTVDLWKYLGDASGKPDLADLLAVWTGVQGYPYIIAKEVPSPSSSGKITTSISLYQSRFFATKKPHDDTTTVWNLPILFTTETLSSQKALIKTKEETVTLEGGQEWVKINAQQSCFCRVFYDKGLLHKLTTAIGNGGVKSNIDRLGLISDYLAFAKGGYTDTATVLTSILPAYRDEEDYTVWCAVVEFESSVRSTIISLLEEESSEVAAYNKLVNNLYIKAFERLGYTPKEGEDDRDSQLRALLLSRLCAAKHQKCIDYLVGDVWKEITEVFASKGSDAAKKLFVGKVAADLQVVTMSTAIRSEEPPSRVNYDIVRSWCSDTDAAFRARCLRCLGVTRSSILLQETGLFALSDEVRPQDSFYVLGSVAANKRGVETFFETLMLKHFKVMWDRFPGMMIGRIVKLIDALPPHGELSGRIEREFWNAGVVSEEQKVSVVRAYQQGLEGLVNRVGWADRDKEGVIGILKAQ
eukprot:Tbor_TRINITY_DN5258_c1_g2::TRINITY_DN5258_c1_g2_i2::g.16661::m.16661/K08776/NPEPPS; puromycin-sensitive aminopeptidase